MPRTYEMQNAPTVEDYVRGLTALRTQVREVHIEAFRAHYSMTNRIGSSKQIAQLAGIEGGWAVVNSLYGKLGHAFCKELGIAPELRPDSTYQWWSVWSRGWNTPEGFVWQMLPQVASAFEQLGWVNPNQEVPPKLVPAAASDADLVSVAEGKVLLRVHRTRERSRKLVTRKKRLVLDETGRLNCEVCGFDFAQVYGTRGEGFAEYHHTEHISQSVAGRRTHLSELAIVCANCHRMLHRRPWIEISENRPAPATGFLQSQFGNKCDHNLDRDK